MVSKHEKEIRKLDELVDEGLYAYNLWEMRRLSAGLVTASGHPAVFYVLQNILSELAELWEDRPVVSARYEPVHHRLAGPIRSVLAGVRSDASGEAILDRLNLLVREFSEVEPDLAEVSN